MASISSPICRTALDAVNCKVSAESILGNNKDVQQRMVGKTRRQTPLLNRFYHFRSKIVHHATQAAVSSLANLTSNPDQKVQLLILGAGLDLSFEESFPQHKVFAIDLPQVTAYRKENHLVRDNTILVEGDLQELPQKVTLTLQEQGFNWTLPTCVVAEVVLCYLSPRVVETVLQSLASRLSSPILITYDPMLDLSADQKDDLSHVLYKKFQEKGSRLLTVHARPTEILEHYYDCGWHYINVWNMYDFMHTMLSAEDRRINVVAEPFDEHADLLLLCQRYSITVASTVDTIFLQASKILLSIREREQSSETIRLIALENRLRLVEAKLDVLQKRLAFSSEVNVRLALKSDEELLKGIYLKAFADYLVDTSVSRYIKSSTKKLGQLINYNSPTSHSKLLVICQGKLVVGCIAIKPTGSNKNESNVESGQSSKEMEVTHFCVSPVNQRRGLGGKLLSVAIEECRRLDAKKIDLSVLQELKAAQALYFKHGFVLVEQQKLTESCVILHLSLQLDK
eukprot:gene9280-10244_t